MSLHPPHEKEQLRAIEIQLATAPTIQKDLKAKFGYGENIFFELDLIEYRINNSLLDIAEDLDVKSLYGIEKNEVARSSVGYAFRGHHNEDFMPDYQFNGLFSEEMNDMIEESRYIKVGRENGHIGGLKASKLGVGVHALTPEERIENGRKGLEAQGKHLWSLEEIAELGELKYEQGLTWNDTASKMNEKYDKDWTTNQVILAYQRNKHLLDDEEE